MPAKETVVRLLWYVESKALTKLTEAREGIFVKVARKNLRHIFPTVRSEDTIQRV